MKNILYFNRTMKLGGTEKVILQLCDTMKDSVDKIVVCTLGGANVERLEKMGIKHYEIPDIERKDQVTIIKTLKMVSKIIKDENINIVHTHHRMAAFYTRILSFFKKFTFINTAHNTFEDKKFLTRFSLKKAKVIAVGEMVKKNLTDFYGLKESQVTVIYNSVEEFDGNFNVIPELEKYKNEGYVLVGNIGRLRPQKGMNYYIEAADKILSKGKKAKFFIIGDGPEKDNLNSQIKSLKREKDIILLGQRQDVQNVMKQLDFIVLSSLWEGLPLIPLEAFSVKKPVVATKVDGTPEIVKNKFNGLLVEAKNTLELSEAMLKLIENNNLIEEYSKNAYETYVNKFSYSIFKKNYIEFYNNIN